MLGIFPKDLSILNRYFQTFCLLLPTNKQYFALTDCFRLVSCCLIFFPHLLSDLEAALLKASHAISPNMTFSFVFFCFFLNRHEKAQHGASSGHSPRNVRDCRASDTYANAISRSVRVLVCCHYVAARLKETVKTLNDRELRVNLGNS